MVEALQSCSFRGQVYAPQYPELTLVRNNALVCTLPSSDKRETLLMSANSAVVDQFILNASDEAKAAVQNKVAF